jgi:hypothetical protein
MPDRETHIAIQKWLAKHDAKKAKRKAVRKAAKLHLKNEEAIATAFSKTSLLLHKVLAEAKARRLERAAKQAFLNFPRCRHQITWIAQKEQQAIQAAAKKFADKVASEAPLSCSPFAPQPKQQPAEPRPFQAGDKVKVKGREGVHVLKDNPYYPNGSEFPLTVPLLHLNGNVEEEAFTKTGHWTTMAQEQDLPPVLELVKDKQHPIPDNEFKCAKSIG